MNQLGNNIDTYFKSKADKANLDLNKEKAWGRLQKKRAKTTVRHVSIAVAVAASILIGLVLLIPTNTYDSNEYLMSEFEKRQKLEEYERKISGTYIETLLCHDCSGEIMKSQVKKVSQNRIQLDIY